MFVIEVTPLKRGIQTDTLSYFGSTSYEPGTMVRIPVRNNEILGLVTKTTEVSTAKTALRAATFSLRKLPQQTNPRTLSPALVKTAGDLARFYATGVGSVLFNLLPPEVQSGEIMLPHTHYIEGAEMHAPEVLQANKRERFLAYRSLVRETFAHSGSVLIVVPTSMHADELLEALEGGIEDRTIVLTSTLPKKKLRDAYTQLEDFSKPKLIIATPAHAIIERHDITIVILENARSPYYKEQIRPYLDHRDVLRLHAKHAGRRLLLADLLIRTEEEFLRREDVYQTYGIPQRRIELQGKLEVLHHPEAHENKNGFQLFLPKVVDLIAETKKRKTHTFLFAARRGLAPVVACMDCAYIFRSPETGAPYSLIRLMKNSVEERWFVCGSSGHRERAADTCPECGSWRLRERGIGIQQVHDELVKLVKDTPIILFDHTTASTYKKAQFLRDTFYKTKGAILLGTHMAIPYLTKPIDNSVIVNMDALYATPTWRLEEENLALLLALREVTADTVYIQTRSKDTELISHAKHGGVEHFYTEELALRESFNYPPFSTFIHLTWQGTPEVAAKIEPIIHRTLAPFEPSYYTSPPSPKGMPIYYALMRVSRNSWPNDALGAALRSLPPSVRVVMNPDRII